MTKKILISGGPVHAFLDDVKIITNRFRGGSMASLVSQFVKISEKENTDSKKTHVTYLCSKNSQQPWWDEFLGGKETPYCSVVWHNGIDDYMEKVLALAPNMDAVVLGAAIANLIPKNKIDGKFPSHNYKEGDTIPIDFTIAPRIIDRVKKVAPRTLLFGYKLLSGVNYSELIRASYGVLLESKAVTIFANDAMDLMNKYAVTKERGVHPIHNDQVCHWIMQRMEEKYYYTSTNNHYKTITPEMNRGKDNLNRILCTQNSSFIHTDEGFVFGSGALRLGDGEGGRNGFVTTARGKNEVEDYAFVVSVDHDERKVQIAMDKKASLNAPLFDNIFKTFKDAHYILHFHHHRVDLPTMDYATPGTDKDSIREMSSPSFNIEGHGCILSHNKIGELLR